MERSKSYLVSATAVFRSATSFFIDDSVKVIIDPGAGLGKLTEIKSQTPIDLIINTHYHFDHIAYNYLFD